VRLTGRGTGRQRLPGLPGDRGSEGERGDHCPDRRA